MTFRLGRICGGFKRLPLWAINAAVRKQRPDPLDKQTEVERDTLGRRPQKMKRRRVCPKSRRAKPSQGKPARVSLLRERKIENEREKEREYKREREAGRVHFLGVLIEKLNICPGRATFDLPCRVVSIRVVTTTFYARPFCLTHSLTTTMMMMKLNNDNNDNQVQRSLTNCSVEMLQHTISFTR